MSNYTIVSSDATKTYSLVLHDENGARVESWGGIKARRVASQDEENAVREDIDVTGLDGLPTREEIEAAIERDYEANV